MGKYRIKGYVKVEVTKVIEADSIDEAEKKMENNADDDVSICCHGSYFTDRDMNVDSDWVLEDGAAVNCVEDIWVEEEE